MKSPIYKELFSPKSKPLSWFNEGDELKVKTFVRHQDHKQQYEIFKVILVISAELIIVENSRAQQYLVLKHRGTIARIKPKSDQLAALWEFDVLQYPDYARQYLKDSA
jgi:hypothetical protein